MGAYTRPVPIWTRGDSWGIIWAKAVYMSQYTMPIIWLTIYYYCKFCKFLLFYVEIWYYLQVIAIYLSAMSEARYQPERNKVDIGR